MLELVCLVAADGRTFSVEIEESKVAFKLVDAIKTTLSRIAGHDISDVSLYLAKRRGDKAAPWLTLHECDADVIADLSSPTIPQNVLDTYMTSDLQLQTGFRLNNERHFGTSFALNDGDIHVLVEVTEYRAVKKARITHTNKAARSVANKINAFNSDRMFGVDFVEAVPFPSLLRRPTHFQLDSNHCFNFQTRQELKPLYDQIVSLWNLEFPTLVNVSGTLGYGTSHMLAALVLLLLKNTLFVAIESLQDIRKALLHESVIFVADRWEAIESDDAPSMKARDNLNCCLGTSVIVDVHGMSMNSKTLRALSYSPSTDDHAYFGGFSDVEFDLWMERRAVFEHHKDELARLTGKVPMLLSVFERVYRDNDSWEHVVQRVLQDQVVGDWMKWLMDFYKNTDADQVWKVYCRNTDSVIDHKIVDYRFYCFDSTSILQPTCEIVMWLMYRVWTSKAATNTVLLQWPSMLDTRNRSVLAIQVEEIVKAKVCQVGVAGKYPKPVDRAIRKISFEPGNEVTVMNFEFARRANEWFLLDPQTFNYPGVDMILVTDNTFVGIKVTISDVHSPLAPFFNLWTPIASARKMRIKGLFIALDNFTPDEKNVGTVLLRGVYSELWKKMILPTSSTSAAKTTASARSGRQSSRKNVGSGRCRRGRTATSAARRT